MASLDGISYDVGTLTTQKLHRADTSRPTPDNIIRRNRVDSFALPIQIMLRRTDHRVYSFKILKLIPLPFLKLDKDINLAQPIVGKIL